MRFMIILSTLALLVTPALAGEIDFGNVRPKKDVFKDLPGVKMPESVTTLRSKLPCSSRIENGRWAGPGVSMPVRVYSCRDGDMVFESTQPPLLDDWDAYKDRQ